MTCPTCGCSIGVIPDIQVSGHGEIRHEPDAASREYDAALAEVETNGLLRAKQIAELNRMVKL